MTTVQFSDERRRQFLSVAPGESVVVVVATAVSQGSIAPEKVELQLQATNEKRGCTAQRTFSDQGQAEYRGRLVPLGRRTLKRVDWNISLTAEGLRPYDGTLGVSWRTAARTSTVVLVLALLVAFLILWPLLDQLSLGSKLKALGALYATPALALSTFVKDRVRLLVDTTVSAQPLSPARALSTAVLALLAALVLPGRFVLIHNAAHPNFALGIHGDSQQMLPLDGRATLFAPFGNIDLLGLSSAADPKSTTVPAQRYCWCSAPWHDCSRCAPASQDATPAPVWSGVPGVGGIHSVRCARRSWGAGRPRGTG